MKMLHRKQSTILMAALLSAAASSSYAATTYKVTTVYNAPGYNGATAMNSNGLVAGQIDVVPVMWDANNKVIVLPEFPSYFDGTAHDINASGQVIYTDNGSSFLWQNGVNTPLFFSPFGINDLGQITGAAELGAVIYLNGVMTLLPGGSNAVGQAINNLGDVAGRVGSNAAVWIDGNLIDIGRLSGANSAYAYGINNQDQVVGDSGGRAFLWQNGVMTELPMLPGSVRAVALNINNNGEIVGYSTKDTPRGPRNYFVTWKNGVVTDLSLVLPSSVGCAGIDINDNGQILANCGGIQRIVATTPGADVGVAVYSTTKADARGDVETGNPVYYTIEVGNTGSFNASNVTVRDVLTAGVTFISATPSKGTCSYTSTLVCSMGSFTPGERATIQLAVMPTAAGTIDNNVSVTMNETDVNSLNDSGTYRLRVVAPVSDINVFMSGPSSVNRYSNVTYSITVTNNGLSNSTGVTLTDALPISMSFVSAKTSQGSCSGTTTVTCNLGAMAYKGTATITIVAQARSKGTFTNSAKSTSLVSDPYTYNDYYKVTTTVK